LRLHRLAIERIGELGERFEQIVCTGALHHLSDPDAGLNRCGGCPRAMARCTSCLRALRTRLRVHDGDHCIAWTASGRGPARARRDVQALPSIIRPAS
jgi:hypothetical protein